jgi:uncharacterized protein YkwD
MVLRLRPARRAVAAAVLAAAASILPATSASAFSTVNGVRLNAVEARLTALINNARRSHGLVTLTVRPGTTDVARRWSFEQARLRTMKHNPALSHHVSGAGSSGWRILAENVGKSRSADTLFNAYMSSPGHRANILDPRVRVLGIGWVELPDGYGYNTQVFTDRYSTTYGPSRVPALGGSADVRRITATTTLADFEVGSDARILTYASGANIHASRATVEPAGAGDQGARFSVSATGGGSGGGADLRIRDAYDLRSVRQLSVVIGATSKTQRAVLVDVYVRAMFGTTTRLGTVTVPHGKHASATFTLPSSARGVRNEVLFMVSRGALAQLDPTSYRGRVALVSIKSVVARV